MAGGYSSSEITVGAGGARKEIMLFGVRVVLDPMRKSVSLNNLSQYELPEEEIPKIGGEDGDGHDKNKVDGTTIGYASADDAVPISSSSGGNRERKRGVPWSEEEHKLFLIGLQKVGKGDWKGISRNFVKSRTSTQVASHAQKYFLRRSNLNRRRRRSSLFDMTTETVIGMSMEEDHTPSRSPSLVPDIANTFPNQPVIQAFPEFLVPISGVNNASGIQSQGHISSSNLINLVPLTFQSKPSPLSLNLSLASSNLNGSSPFKIIPSFNGGDNNNSNMIGVA